MKDDDLEATKRLLTNAVVPQDTVLLENNKRNKVKITINLDKDVIAYFKHRGAETAKGYQTLINEALRNYIGLGMTSDLITELIKRVQRLEAKLLS